MCYPYLHALETITNLTLICNLDTTLSLVFSLVDFVVLYSSVQGIIKIYLILLFRAKLMIGGAWGISFIICFPPLIGWNTRDTPLQSLLILFISILEFVKGSPISKDRYLVKPTSKAKFKFQIHKFLLSGIAWPKESIQDLERLSIQSIYQIKLQFNCSLNSLGRRRFLRLLVIIFGSML